MIIFNGISGAQFQELPMLKQVFDTLDLNTQAPQTLVLHVDQELTFEALVYLNQVYQILASALVILEIVRH
jgi:hypothetical protein